MENFQIMLRNWKTTILGFIPMVGAILIALGVIDLEQQTAIYNGVEVVFDASDSILNEVIGGMAVIGSIIALFSRDADKTSEKSGIKRAL